MVMDKSILVVVLLLSFLSIGAFHFCSCNGDPKVICTQKERQALLSFKKGLNDSSNRLSSWDGDEDCCTWIGVDCNNITGHVVELHLAIHTIVILLGNLSSLRYLDLGWNYEFESSSLYVDDLGWLSHLSSLKYFGISSVDLHRAVDWLQVVNTLPSLSELHMRRCSLGNIPLSLGYVNFTSLVVLNLSNNFFNSTIPNWLFNLSNSLLHLDLSGNSLQGHIPNAIGNLKSHQFLYLSFNHFIEGRIPNTLWNLSKLESMDLSYNQAYS
ncbi:hypothetical protein HHK36_001180 [Tetracentron sinense]|uniref:Leucine-rich repeat-containing N-terminal plant-type domain-containing protein n=1 Tax=Tetracentron sinense TaxID=13715 RepID=A0A834ZSE0_TETSI|nr:hypothetical protein HHK36_001180 [Tetracentron sinense]